MNNNEVKKIRKVNEKYKVHEKLLIARAARKTLRYIEKNTENFPSKYQVLKNRIIETCYNILEWTYRANVFQEINDKKEVVVQIQMLNFYLEESLRKDIISSKKFLSYSSHLIELDKMVRAWIQNETIK